jgi:hypothetical protein
MRRGWVAMVALVVPLVGCASPAVLVDEADLDGVQSAEQNTEHAIAPGWTWCSAISPNVNMRAPYTGSRFELEDGTSVGATLLDRRAEGLTATAMLQDVVDAADQCALEARPDDLGTAIEPLDGLQQDARGWRTVDPEGRRGEYVVQPWTSGASWPTASSPGPTVRRSISTTSGVSPSRVPSGCPRRRADPVARPTLRGALVPCEAQSGGISRPRWTTEKQP